MLLTSISAFRLGYAALSLTVSTNTTLTQTIPNTMHPPIKLQAERGNGYWLRIESRCALLTDDKHPCTQHRAPRMWIRNGVSSRLATSPSAIDLVLVRTYAFLSLAAGDGESTVSFSHLNHWDVTETQRGLEQKWQQVVWSKSCGSRSYSEVTKNTRIIYDYYGKN